MTARILPLDQVGIIQSEAQLRHPTEITLLLVSRIAFHNPKTFRDEGRCQKWSAPIPSTLESILVQVFKTQSKYKNRKMIYTFLPWLLIHSHVSDPTGPSAPSSLTAPLMPIMPMWSCPASSSHLLLPRPCPRCHLGWVQTHSAS